MTNRSEVAAVWLDRYSRITEYGDATSSSSLVLEHGLDQLHWLVTV
jgi:hypothetical protein